MKENKTTFINISGINFPTKKRNYLMNLFKEVCLKEKPNFVIVAGNTVDGKYLEKELKGYIKFQLVYFKPEDPKNAKIERQEFIDGLEEKFVEEQTKALNLFLPRIHNANYHIVISENVYDRQIGIKILEKLRYMRDDIRLIGKQNDGSYDSEVKITSQLKGFEEIRVIVPGKAPWFYKIITSFMQRLINSFVPRTFSPPPSMIIVGCTGTASYLPYYEGVPCISVPTLHKIQEQKSTENMVGCSVVNIISTPNGIKINNGTYDFRPAIFKERQFTIPEKMTRLEKAVLNALIPSDASIKTIVFRITAKNKKTKKNGISEEKVRITMENLIAQKIVVYGGKSNRYSINENLIQENANISLESIFSESRTVKHTVLSCVHAGALKSLYYTAIYHLPELTVDSDALIENGDEIEGIAHDYEYNGELLPIAYGFDKQELLAAHIRAKNILDVFKMKYAVLKDKKKMKPVQVIKNCFITYIYNLGNHPSWKTRTRHALILYQFEDRLKQLLIEGLLNLCTRFGLKKGIDYKTIKAIVEEKIIRMGESQMVNLNGVIIGIKHPFKPRAESKSHRIQDVVNFIWRAFQQFAKKIAKNSKGFALVDVANFHECAAVHVTKFGRTILGVMTGAYLRDTSFENNKDKVVDYGSANVIAVINKDDRLLYSEVQFDNWIHPEDEKIVLADKIKTSDVNALCSMLTNEVINLPWR